MTRSRGLASSAFRGLKIKPMLSPSGNKVCILARAPGGQMRGAATQAMPVCIVEERQQSRYAPLPPRPSGLRPAGPLAVLLAPYIPHRVCSSLAPCQRAWGRSEEHTSELQSHHDLVCRLLLEKKHI